MQFGEMVQHRPPQDVIYKDIRKNEERNGVKEDVEGEVYSC